MFDSKKWLQKTNDQKTICPMVQRCACAMGRVQTRRYEATTKIMLPIIIIFTNNIMHSLRVCNKILRFVLEPSTLSFRKIRVKRQRPSMLGCLLLCMCCSPNTSNINTFICFRSILLWNIFSFSTVRVSSSVSGPNMRAVLIFHLENSLRF